MVRRRGMTLTGRAVSRQEAERRWDEVATAWSCSTTPLWRRQSDAVNRLLIERWLPAQQLEAILKTDLFDEFAGAGLVSVLQRHAARVSGIDVSPLVAASARRRHPSLETGVADVRELPFAEHTFDVIVSNSTLDHLAGRGEVTAALGELRRVLRPDGTLVLTMDNPLNPLIFTRNALPPRIAAAVRRVPYGVGWTCGPKTLRNVLAQAGFVIRELTAILHAPRVLVAAIDRSGWARADAWLRLVLAGERLEGLPTRYLTGHFLAARAVPASDQRVPPP
jgi:SAM-dependent methyltransferase